MKKQSQKVVARIYLLVYLAFALLIGFNPVIAIEYKVIILAAILILLSLWAYVAYKGMEAEREIAFKRMAGSPSAAPKDIALSRAEMERTKAGIIEDNQSRADEFLPLEKINNTLIDIDVCIPLTKADRERLVKMYTRCFN